MRSRAAITAASSPAGCPPSLTSSASTQNDPKAKERPRHAVRYARLWSCTLEHRMGGGSVCRDMDVQQGTIRSRIREPRRARLRDYRVGTDKARQQDRQLCSIPGSNPGRRLQLLSSNPGSNSHNWQSESLRLHSTLKVKSAPTRRYGKANA